MMFSFKYFNNRFLAEFIQSESEGPEMTPLPVFP